MPRVLIVDDSPDFRQSIAARLQKTGHEVGFAGDGSEALSYIQREHVDLILLDYQMPVWDGVESMVLFKHNRVKSPVIAYTCKDRRSTSPFESVMLTLGTVASIRCSDGTDELIQAAEQFLSPGGTIKPKIVPHNEHLPEGLPRVVDWSRVRMLTFNGLTVSLVLQGEKNLEFTFGSRDEMDRVLNTWFQNA